MDLGIVSSVRLKWALIYIVCCYDQKDIKDTISVSKRQTLLGYYLAG